MSDYFHASRRAVSHYRVFGVCGECESDTVIWTTASAKEDILGPFQCEWCGEEFQDVTIRQVRWADKPRWGLPMVDPQWSREW